MTLSPLKQALLALDKMQAKLDAQAAAAYAPLAVVGLGCRLPGADSPAALWRLLLAGGDAVREVPAARWSVAEHFDPDPEAPGKMSTRWGGFLDGIDQFDAEFFGIAPREAERMDPQQRLVLEVAWEALEHAGQPAAGLAGSRTGVFMGFCFNDYARQLLAGVEEIDAYTSTGGANSILANRLSYFLDLRGPSLTVDTACSSSLVSVHLACRSLRTGECDLALAGGVNVMLDPPWTVSFTKFGMMAKDGRCKSFDARADGFVRGEGCGVVVLKRLADARSDGDPILAVIRGTAVNQDGRTNGLTAPNGHSQQAVVRAALADAGLAPAAIGFVESHGTGTILGDPIEVEALNSVYGGAGETPCAVGAIKTNLGHLEAAAGIAGLIKAVLAVRYGMVPPNLHFKTLNPGIEVAGSRLVFPTTPTPWRAASRAAGVSSFGFGGTNAHIVLTQAPEEPREPATEGGLGAVTGPHLLPVSARGSAALQALAQRYRDVLSAEDAPAAGVLCAAAAHHRSAFDHRLAIIGADATELVTGLDAYLSQTPAADVVTGVRRRGRAPGLVFVFPGQGAQWLGMGRQLLTTSEAFRQTIDACDAAIRAETGWSVRAELAADATGSRLAEVDVVQPTLFAVQVALAAHWRSWGVEPDAVIGHSMGEVAAAYVAGALTLADAVAVICRRSRLLRRVAGKGEMAVVELSFAEAESALAEVGDAAQDVSVAASNSPRSTVLSGTPAALGAVLTRLEAEGVFCRRIRVDVASHSPAIEPLRADLLAALADLRPRTGSTVMLSTVSVEPIAGDQLDADYWVRNLRQPVRLHAAIEVLQADDHSLFVEISPHPILLPAIEPGIVRAGGSAWASLHRDDDEQRALLASLGGLFCSGLVLDWRMFPRPRQRVALPSYPWQRERFWHTDGPSDAGSSPPAAAPSARSVPSSRPHPDGLLGSPWVAAFAPERRCFELILRPETDTACAYLTENEVHGHHLVPGTLLLELMRAAAATELGTATATTTDAEIVLEAVRFHEPLLLPNRGGRRLQLVVTGAGAGEATAEIFAPVATDHAGSGPATTPAAWPRYASARLRLDRTPASVPAAAEPVTAAEPADHRVTTDQAATFYQRLRVHGLHCGPAFQGLVTLTHGDGTASGEVVSPPVLVAESMGNGISEGWHPALLEAVFHVLAAALPEERGTLYLSAGVGTIRFVAQGAPSRASSRRGRQPLRVVARVRPSDDQAWLGDLRLHDADGRLLLVATDVRLVPLDGVASGGVASDGGAELLTAAARRQLGGGDTGAEYRARLVAATPGPERRGLLEDHVRNALGTVLKLAPARIDMACSLSSYGTDSVMTLKLRNQLEETLGLTLSASVIWNHPTLGALTDYLAERLGLALDVGDASTDGFEAGDPVRRDDPPATPNESVEAQLERELALVDALLEDA